MSVMLVRRRATVNRAVEWTGENTAEAREFLGDDYAGIRLGVHGALLMIRTLEHPNVPFLAPPGSVILEGNRAHEHWAVAPAAFYETYEKVGEEA